ncbi:hypothetical protein AC578_1354 [Pseudocercospora eumusae]|uniref:Uncharacterized protein n=1 Tax=Pseudocercospora eumusae TaxID=321146 RepID=A0A139HUJ0_9PEZI|nr:hypothetical protein AC578_1354 [Pseudocercospora eumusae]
MAKRKAGKVEAGSSDHPSKAAKLTREDSQADSIDQADSINANTDSIDQADNINANTNSNDTENGVAATNSDETTPTSPQDPSTDSKNLTTAEPPDTDLRAPTPKRSKKATAAKSHTRKSPRTKNEPDTTTTTNPVRKPINNLLKAKITSILNYLNTTPLPSRDRETNTLTLTKSHLLAALMTLRQDFELGDPNAADIHTDVGEEALVGEFSAPNGTLRGETEWVVVDFGVKTEIEKEIGRKVEGWGLEGVRVLEVEIWVLGREMEGRAGVRFLEAVEGVEDEVEEVEGGKRFGVCPVPAADVF